jgi:hypothetical protein
MERATKPEEGQMSAQNVSTISELYAAFGRGEIPAVLAAMSPDADWQAPASIFGAAGHAHGPDGIGQFFGGLSGYFSELHVEPKELIDGGDKVVAIGQHTGSGAKGSFQASFVHVWTLRDGKVTAFMEVADTAPIAAAI